MPTELSRREFLRCASAAAGLPLLDRLRLPGGAPELGRVVTPTVARAAPKPDGKALKSLAFNDLLTITGAVEGIGHWEHNLIWYNTPDGYVYSSFVQPVENLPQPVVWDLPPEGYWAEVSVPLVVSRGKPDPQAWRSYKLYYSTVYRVISVQAAADGSAWYGLAEGEYERALFYAPAEGLRIIPAGDLAPLAPGAEKLIKITLSTQILEAFENGQLVFSGRVSSGAKGSNTPKGRFKVIRKSAASHMSGGVAGSLGAYDLPGVPFCTYFTPSAVAVHGAYWHNDFGRPRSHGCLNMLASDARWVFRWTEPSVPYDMRQMRGIANGTAVEVVA